MSDEEYVYDEASGEWIPASEAAAKADGGEDAVEVDVVAAEVLV